MKTKDKYVLKTEVPKKSPLEDFVNILPEEYALKAKWIIENNPYAKRLENRGLSGDYIREIALVNLLRRKLKLN